MVKSFHRQEGGTRSTKVGRSRGRMVHILGLYKVPQELTIWKGRSLEEYEATQLEGLWLVEVTLTKLESYEPDFIQPDPGIPKNDWQCAYFHVFLDPSGSQRQKPLIGSPARLVFFLHRVDINKPILFQSREYLLPKPSPIPDRLKEIVFYDVP